MNRKFAHIRQILLFLIIGIWLISGNISITYSQQTMDLRDYWLPDLAWNFDGSLIASNSGNSLQIWDANSGILLRTLSGHTDRILDISWSPTNNLVATASYDQTVRVWNGSTGQFVRTITGSTDAVSDVFWSANGDRIFAVSNSQYNGLRVWDSSTGNLQSVHDIGSPSKVAWKPDGTNFAYVTLGGSINIVDSVTLDRLNRYQVPSYDEYLTNGLLYALAYNSNGSQIATGSIDGTVYVWDASTGAVLLSLASTDNYVSNLYGVENPLLTWVRDIAFDATGTKLSAITADGTVRVWNAQTGEILQTTSVTAPVYTASFSPNGDRIAFAGANSSVAIVAAPSQFQPATPTPTPTLTPTPTITPAPQPSSLINNIVAANGKTYTRDTVAAGNTLYIDRTYTFVTVPAELAGQDYIRTANADKQLTTPDFLSFSLSQSAAVYVMYDTRYPIPPWLRGWTDTGQDVVATEVNNTQLARRLYRRDYPAGTVVLGANRSVNASVMYNVIAAPITENVVYRMDVGSTTGYTSAAGVVWGADNYFTGGSLSNLPNPILNTADDALYTFQRTTTSDTAGFSYALPVTNGTYTVRLHFAETYWVGGANRGTPGVGKRVFNVQLEGTTVLTNYDLTAQVGALAADIRTFTVTVTDGTLNINFPAASVNRPTLAALEVIGQ